MFFHRNHRIRTEPRIPNEVEDDPRHHQRRIKIKNIRFSFEQDPHKPLPTRTDDPSSEMPNPHKRLGIGQRLPELVLEREEEEIKEARETSVQHRKKDILLNSILQILRPPRPLPLRPLREWRLDSSKDYVNEFVDELPHFNSTKHYRAPKLIENEILRSKNSNIARRKIFSEDKDRQRESQKAEELEREKKEQRPEADLQKIEIITFSNKFPGLKKEGSQVKPQQ